MRPASTPPLTNLASGMGKALARAELLKVMRGEPSEVLKKIAPPARQSA